MGKKGKMSMGRNDGAGKWATQSNLRNLSDSIHEARKSAYDHAAIEYKRMEEMTKQRKRLIFPHLNYLVKERLYDDSHRNLPSSQYDPSWYRQMLHTTKGNTDKTIIKTSEVAKRKFITSLLSVYSTSSIMTLSSLCVHTIAKTAYLYESEDLRFALSTIPYDKTELFSLLCCLYNTQSDENISVLSHDFLQKAYLSSGISDQGVRTLLQDMHHSRRGQYTALESWEMIDPTEISASTFMGLKEVYLLSSPVSSSTVSLIGEECYNLCKLCLYDVQFLSEQVVDPIVFCLQFFELLSAGFTSLTRLELLQCAWIRREGIQLWARNLAQQRILGESILPNLQILCLSKVYKSHDETVPVLMRTGDDSAEHSWEYLESFLLSHCGINVEFVS